MGQEEVNKSEILHFLGRLIVSQRNRKERGKKGGKKEEEGKKQKEGRRERGRETERVAAFPSHVSIRDSH